MKKKTMSLKEVFPKDRYHDKAGQDYKRIEEFRDVIVKNLQHEMSKISETQGLQGRELGQKLYSIL